MSRRSTNSDSLEMLLDTMCNTFGVIILISMILTLLARDSSPESTPSNTSAQPDPNAEAYRMAASFHEELRRRSRAVDATLQLLDGIQETEKRLTGAAAELDRNRQESDKTQASRNALSRTNLDLRKQQDRILAEIRRIQDQTSAISNRRTININPPLFQEEKAHGLRAPRTRWDMIVRDDLLYPIYHRIANAAVRNDVTIDWRPKAGSSTDFSLSPNPGMGLDFSRNSNELDKLLKSLSPQEQLLQFFLYPNSFATFPNLREAVMRHGFGYNVVFVPDTDLITISPDASNQEVGSLVGGSVPP